MEKEEGKPRVPERPGGVGQTQKETSHKLTRVVEDLFPCRNLATVKTTKRHLNTLKKQTADGILFCNHNHPANRHHDNTHILKRCVRRQNTVAVRVTYYKHNCRKLYCYRITTLTHSLSFSLCTLKNYSIHRVHLIHVLLA